MPDTLITQDRQRARSFAVSAADGLLTEGRMAADYAARMLLALSGAGLSAAKIDALRDTVLDAFGDAQGGINRMLDEEHLYADQHQIDLSEIEQAAHPKPYRQEA